MVTCRQIFPVSSERDEVLGGFRPQLEAGIGSERGPRGKIMLEPADAARLVAAVEQQRVQVKLDRVDGQEPERSARERLAGPAQLPKGMSR